LPLAVFVSFFGQLAEWEQAEHHIPVLVAYQETVASVSAKVEVVVQLVLSSVEVGQALEVPHESIEVLLEVKLVPNEAVANQKYELPELLASPSARLTPSVLNPSLAAPQLPQCVLLEVMVTSSQFQDPEHPKM